MENKLAESTEFSINRPRARTTAIAEVNYDTTYNINFASFFGSDIIKIINAGSNGAIGIAPDLYLIKLFQYPQVGSILSWIIETDNVPLSIVGESASAVLVDNISKFSIEITSPTSPISFNFIVSSISGSSGAGVLPTISSGTGYVLFAGSSTTISSTGTFHWDIQNQKLAIGKTSNASRSLEVLDNSNPQLRISYTGILYNDYQNSTGSFKISSSSSTASIGIGNSPNVVSATGGTISVGYQTGVPITGPFSNTIAIGYQSSTTQAPYYSMSIGAMAGVYTNGNQTSLNNIGYQATGFNGFAGIGYKHDGGFGAFSSSMGVGYSSRNELAIGCNACRDPQPLAGGFGASIGIGTEAGMSQYRNSGVDIGYQAGKLNQEVYGVAIGVQAGFQDQRTGATAVGYQAGQYNQGTFGVAMGYQAGQYSQGSDSVAIGYQSGQYNQCSGAVAIGYQAGQYSQPAYSILVGYQAGQYGTDSITGCNIAFGKQAGQYSQNARAIAFGTQAGQYSQGVDAIAFGTQAGQYIQGFEAIAVGYQAGQHGQGTGAIAIGKCAGQTGQGQYAIAVGTESGQYSQGQNCIAIGYQAGQYSQGEYSICIGYQAGQTNQAPRTIVLNGTQTPLSGSTSDALYIAPISNNNAQTQALCYDTGTNEITYATSGVKTFIIQHPEYEDSYLIHACLEGPEAGVYYRGQGFIESESCTINLPTYTKHWKNFSVYLTPKLPIPKTLGRSATVNFPLSTSDVENGKFTVFGNTGTTFNWVVYASRGDIEVEMKKSNVKVKGQGPYRYV